ncbi:MAG: sugar kinase, partial [Candidatus Limnocylindria bacterium]
MGANTPPTVPPEQLDSLVTVLDLVRSGLTRTRPEIVRVSGLGRNIVAQRVAQLIECGLVAEGSLGRSTGGRAPRELQFRADAGHVLVAELGATSIGVALSDLAGNLRHQRV